MRLTPRNASATLIGLLAIVLALAPGCSSRKRVSTEAQIPEPPTESTGETLPPPSTEREDTSTGGESTDRLSLEDAFFDFDDFSLRSDAKSALERDGKYLQQNSGTKVVIEGHCDERGSVEYNLALGEKRARAAKEYLVSYGIPANRVTTISYGKERPFDPGHDEDAWAKNRRAHVVSR